MPDLLERLWGEVINLNHDGKNGWIARLDRQASKKVKLASRAEAAFKNLPRIKVDQENLTRLSRFVRYEACFGTLYSMSDPGTGKTAGLSKKLAQHDPGGGNAFFKSLWELIAWDDDGDWLMDLAKKKPGTAPFDDVGPAVATLLKNGAKTPDLGRFCAWQRYDTCVETLRLVEESGMSSAEEADGLYESLLGAEPSGMEGRPGSWPVKRKKLPARPAPDEPLYCIRAVQACAFSNDGQTLAVAGASSPVRLLDPATGAERRTCEGIKAHIYRITFSPDDKQVAAGKIHKEITVCDTRSGKLLSSCKRTGDEISGLAYSNDGQLVCSSWCDRIMIFDPRTGKALDSLSPFQGHGMVNHMAFSPDGRELLAHWQGEQEEKCHATIWSWPSLKPLLDIKVGDGYSQRVCWLNDGNQFAISDRDTGVTVYERASGRKLHRFGDKETELLAVTQSGKHMITSGAEDKICIWNSETRKKLRELDFWALEATVSRDGQYLVGANSGNAAVWQLSSLV
jgi:hypothetical protein